MPCNKSCEEVETRWCCKCWNTRIPPVWVVICAAITVQIGFGLYPVLVTIFAFHEKTNAYIFSFYRDATAFPVLLICTLVAERKLMIPSWRMTLLFAVLGLTGMFGGQLCYITGVYLLGPDVASAYQPIMPVIAVVLAIVTRTERPPNAVHLHTWARLLGILLSVGGAIEVALTGYNDEPATDILPTNLSNSTDTGGKGAGLTFVGYIMVFCNTSFTATYVILQKRFIFNRPDCKWRDHPVAVTTYSYMFGAIFMALASLYFVFTGQTSEFYIPLDSLYVLVYAVFVTSALCYLLLTWSNLHLPSSVVTAFWPVQVLVAGVAAFFLTGDTFAPWQYVGAVVVLAGLMLVLFSSYMDERLNSGKRAIRFDSCFLKCCPKRRHANRRLVNIEDFVSVNHEGEDDNMNSDLEVSSKISGEESDKDHGESDALLDSNNTKYYGIGS